LKLGFVASESKCVFYGEPIKRALIVGSNGTAQVANVSGSSFHS